MSQDKWYNSRAGWIGFFKKHHEKIRHLAAYHSGSWAGNQLDKFKDIDEKASDEQLRILYGILHKVWEDAPDASWIHCMTGWAELCDLCSEGYVLWEGEHASTSSSPHLG